MVDWIGLSRDIKVSNSVISQKDEFWFTILNINTKLKVSNCCFECFLLSLLFFEE